MKQSQKERILEMLEKAPNNEVTCWDLAQEFLYHKAASRIGEIEREKGIRIEFIKGDTVMNGRYKLHKVSANTGIVGTITQAGKSTPAGAAALPVKFEGEQMVFC